MRRGPADPRRLRSFRLGLFAELVAAACLVVRGYRILARRAKSALGEIDLIAVRGRRLAFVEVKYRATREDALTALEAANHRRIASAAEAWVARNRRYLEHDMGFDAVLIVPWRLPVYLRDALQPIGTDARADR